MPTLHVDTAISLSGKATVMENGWLRAPANLTKIGVFEYKTKTGSRHELRLPEEVFHSDTMKSFAMLPITDGHPGAPLTAANTKQHQIGNVGENIEKNGSFVTANVMVTDEKAIKQILAGEKVQLSCGYYADVEETPGEYNGMHYDSIQRNIRGNHVALCYEGRAGPDVRIRLDANENCVVQIDHTDDKSSDQGSKPLMARFTIDDTEFELDAAVCAALVREKDKRSLRKDELKAARKALKTELETAQGELTKAQARADSAEADLKKAQASTGENFAKAVKARVELESVANKFEIKCDALDDQAIKVAVVEKVRGEKLTRTDSAYVDASFDLALTSASAVKGSGYQLRADSMGANIPDANSARTARKNMYAELEKPVAKIFGAVNKE
jgi:hypothetical protein